MWNLKPTIFLILLQSSQIYGSFKKYYHATKETPPRFTIETPSQFILVQAPNL